MFNWVHKDTVYKTIIIGTTEVKVPELGLVEDLILEDDEIDIEEVACRLRRELIAYQRGQRDKAWAEKIIELCNQIGWKIIFAPNCFTGVMEPDFVKTFNNEYVIKEFGCEFYHGHLVD